MAPDRVHDAVQGYREVADTYHRVRPDYPAAAVAHVVDRLAIAAGARVLDLAAGTGKLTAPLAATGAQVVAVDPIPEMLDALASRLPGVETRAGTAEAIPVPDHDVDAVAVAQAFHWFDPGPALDEIARVLRPGRGLALLWNRRDEADPLWARISDVLEPHRAGVPAHRDDTWRAAVDDHAAFAPLATVWFANPQPADRDVLVGRVASISFVASMAPDERDALLAEVRAIPDELGLPDRIVLRYTTEVHTTVLR